MCIHAVIKSPGLSMLRYFSPFYAQENVLDEKGEKRGIFCKTPNFEIFHFHRSAIITKQLLSSRTLHLPYYYLAYFKERDSETLAPKFKNIVIVWSLHSHY